MSINEVADGVSQIYEKHEEGAYYAAGYDGGEFSGPAISRIADAEAEQYCKDNGFSLAAVHAYYESIGIADSNSY